MDDMTHLLTGEGLIHLDIALGLLAAATATIQYWRIATWRSHGFVLAGRWMIAVGWTIIAGRITQTLIMVGDILISLPSLIALILVSAGSILVTMFWRKGSEGPR
jgi:hypothetical protein